MKKILSILLAAAFSLSMNAQEITDASKYFSGNAYGWATVADEAGTPYQMDGAMRNAKPRTIVLTSTGKDMKSDIEAAINNYDLIIFDGSKGQFVISGSVNIANAKNKSIVGRNDAELCTEFYLTAEDINYLNDQGLEKLSSTDQYTGTLPDGTTMTCDRRAFFTKKAMMELQYKKTGVYSIPSHAGIFNLKSTDENIIFRNLTFVGPGAVDIDGADLITNEEAKHIWIDHCSFIDGQDGCLDSKRCDYASYTWNEFFYTSRSFSHGYTNGCGWADGAMTLHLTFANNVWGNGCMRRLPQCGDCFVHIVNNYYNCPGNSAMITINGGCTALVEGNMHDTGVKSPFTLGGTGNKVLVRNNSFTYNQRTPPTITVPYTYDIVDYTEVPELLLAENGAGATLKLGTPGDITKENGFGFWDEEMTIVKDASAILGVKNYLGVAYSFSSSDASVVTVDAAGKITAVGGGEAYVKAVVTNDPVYGSFEKSIKIIVNAGEATYETYKKWEFKWSSTTLSDLSEDGDWSSDGTNYTYSLALNNEELTANSSPIAETEGLLFINPKEGNTMVIYGSGRLRLNKPGQAIIIPSLKTGDKVLVKFRSAKSSDSRGFDNTNLSKASFRALGSDITDEGLVLADGDVTLTASGGIYVSSVEVQRLASSSTGITSIATPMPAISTAYNLAGQRVNASAKGIVIIGGKKVVR